MLAANVTRVNPVRVMESLPAYTPVMAVRSFFEAVSRSLSYRQRSLQVSGGTHSVRTSSVVTRGALVTRFQHRVSKNLLKLETLNV